MPATCTLCRRRARPRRIRSPPRDSRRAAPGSARDHHGLGDVALQMAHVAHDLHRAPAQHVGRADDQRKADALGDLERLGVAAGDAVLRLLQPQPDDQILEPLAVLGEIDGVGRGAEDRDALGLEPAGELERRLPAELHDHPVQRAALLLDAEDLHHVLEGQRLEIEPVGGVVIGADRLGVAVDHDRLEAGIRQRETGVTAAIVELDPLTDPVRAAAEDHDLFRVRRAAPRIPPRPSSGPRRSNTCRASAPRTRRRRCRSA